MSGLEKTVAYTGDGLKYKSDKAYEATAAGQFARNFSKQSANATDLVAYRAANSVTESKQAINIMRDAITKSHSE